MNGILELSKAKERVSVDTWIMAVPDEVCEREGLAKGTLVSMTIKNGGIQTEFISPPNETLTAAGKHILLRDRELHQRLKAVGD